MQNFCIFSQALANARTTLQTNPELRKLFHNKGVRYLFGRGDVQFPKLDVVGSNPIARFGRKLWSEREIALSIRRRMVRPTEVLTR